MYALWGLFRSLSSSNDQTDGSFENLINNIDFYDFEELCLSIGIEPPVLSDRYNYVIDNISNYHAVYYRDDSCHLMDLHLLKKLDNGKLVQHISKLRDQEIFLQLDIKVGYTSRTELEDNSVRTFTSNCFFIPVYGMRSTNSHTIIGTEIKDSSTFFIGYGTVYKYFTYELDDLVGAFYEAN